MSYQTKDRPANFLDFFQCFFFLFFFLFILFSFFLGGGEGVPSKSQCHAKRMASFFWYDHDSDHFSVMRLHINMDLHDPLNIILCLAACSRENIDEADPAKTVCLLSHVPLKGPCFWENAYDPDHAKTCLGKSFNYNSVKLKLLESSSRGAKVSFGLWICKF